MGTYVGPKRADVFFMFVIDVAKRDAIEKSYRAYVTKQLVAMANHKTLAADWLSDIIEPKAEQATKDGDSIVREVVGKAGLVVRRR